MTHQLNPWNQYEKYYCEPCALWIFIRQQSSHEKSEPHQRALRRHQQWRDREKRTEERHEKQNLDMIKNLDAVARETYVRKDLGLGAAEEETPLQVQRDTLRHLQSRADNASIGPQIPRMNAMQQQQNAAPQEQTTSKPQNKRRNKKKRKQETLPIGRQDQNEYMKYYDQYKQQTQQKIDKEREESLRQMAMEHARRDAEQRIREELMREMMAQQGEDSADDEESEDHIEGAEEEGLPPAQPEEQHPTEEDDESPHNAESPTNEEEGEFIEVDEETLRQYQQEEEPQQEPENDEDQAEYMELDDEEAAQFFGGSLPTAEDDDNLEAKYYQDPTFFMTENADVYLQQQKLQELEDKIREEEEREERERQEQLLRETQERIDLEDRRQRELKAKEEETIAQRIRDQKSGIYHNTGYGAWEDAGEEIIEAGDDDADDQPKPNSLWQNTYDYTQTQDYKKRKHNESGESATPQQTLTSTTSQPAVKRKKFSMTFK